MLFPSPLLPLSPLATPEDSFLMALLSERKTIYFLPVLSCLLTVDCLILDSFRWRLGCPTPQLYSYILSTYRTTKYGPLAY